MIAAIIINIAIDTYTCWLQQIHINTTAVKKIILKRNRCSYHVGLLLNSDLYEY